jgi:hypothetical protein
MLQAAVSRGRYGQILDRSVAEWRVQREDSAWHGQCLAVRSHGRGGAAAARSTHVRIDHRSIECGIPHGKDQPGGPVTSSQGGIYVQLETHKIAGLDACSSGEAGHTGQSEVVLKQTKKQSEVCSKGLLREKTLEYLHRRS